MRILIIEDEKEISSFLKSCLEGECFVVDTAEDGERGSFLALSNEYDLIILDNMLPKKEGRQVCEEIRKEGKTVPIIMLSVKSEVTTKIDLLNAGADDYLTKPFSFQELMARIRALLRRPKNMTSDKLELDNLVIDTKNYTVKRGERQIYLTKKEFTLLEYLIKNNGSVLSRNMIIEHVWDMNTDPFSNTVESHIANLRKKIDMKNEKRLIHTLTGRGYKMEVMNNE